jgi:hypothetical protein
MLEKDTGDIAGFFQGEQFDGVQAVEDLLAFLVEPTDARLLVGEAISQFP